jgi:hypothetical protein
MKKCKYCDICKEYKSYCIDINCPIARVYELKEEDRIREAENNLDFLIQYHPVGCLIFNKWESVIYKFNI